MGPGVHRGAAAALPLAMLCVMSAPAPAFHHPCPDCETPGDIPFQWDDGASQPPVIGPFPQGFAQTVAVTLGHSLPGPTGTLDRYVQVAPALGRCVFADVAPDSTRWNALTLRVSFRRDGAVNGIPRVVDVSAADAAGQAQGRDQVLAALSRCTPLPLSPSLGRAIAGQIFAIRFVQQRNI